MDTTVIVLIVVVVVLLVALAVVGVMFTRRKRSEQLQDRYGPEYQRALAETDGDRRAAEQELADREKRHSSLDIRELDDAERDRFAARWTDVQRGFVDDPVLAVDSADSLVNDIMRTRGFPVDDVERRADDISVEQPRVVERYREASEIRNATREGRADTEQQRRAVTAYRDLIDALLDGSATEGRHHHNDRPVEHRQTEEHTR